MTRNEAIAELLRAYVVLDPDHAAGIVRRLGRDLANDDRAALIDALGPDHPARRWLWSH